MGIVRILGPTAEGGQTTVLLVDMTEGGKDHQALGQIVSHCFGFELEHGYLSDAFYESSHLKDTDAQAVLLALRDDDSMLTVAWAIIAPRPNDVWRIGWIQTSDKYKGKGFGSYLLRKTIDYLFNDRKAARVTLEDASHGTGTHLYKASMARYFHVAEAGNEFTYTQPASPVLAHRERRASVGSPRQ